ncbi:MAG: Abi family protein [Roseburia faecis]
MILVKSFLAQSTLLLLENSKPPVLPLTNDLIHKYFTIQRIYNTAKQKKENKIVAYDDCPAWVLLEMLTFGDFIKFYEFYYSSRSYPKLSTPVINLVKSLRNGAAHNNCILADLAHGTSKSSSRDKPRDF